MDPALVRAYKARYQAVAEIEAAEQQQSTIEDRVQQLNAIVRMAMALGFDLQAQSNDDAIVWERWAKLKEVTTRDNP